jgi:hypothetical protein
MTMTPYDSKAIDLLDQAADQIAAAAGSLLWSRRDADHAAMYRAGAALTRITGALQEIVSHLADAAENYADRPDLRDDAGADPSVRLMSAVTYLLQAATGYRRAELATSSYQSTIGHVGTDGGHA